MTPPVMLAEYLAELEKQWRRRNPALVSRLRPGLARQELEAVLSPFARPIPEELYTWWGWHDGAEGNASITDSDQLVSAQQSVDHTLQAGRIVREAGGAQDLSEVAGYTDLDGGLGFPDAQLMILVSGGSDFVGVNCTEAGDRAAVGWYRYDESPNGRLVASSLAEFVERLCALYEDDAFQWDQRTQRWLGDGRSPIVLAD